LPEGKAVLTLLVDSRALLSEGKSVLPLSGHQGGGKEGIYQEKGRAQRCHTNISSSLSGENIWGSNFYQKNLSSGGLETTVGEVVHNREKTLEQYKDPLSSGKGRKGVEEEGKKV